MKFNEKLKLIRKTYDLTQLQLAKQIGVSRGHIANMELGTVNPTPLFINCLSLTYGIDKDWLINDSNDDSITVNLLENTTALIIEEYEKLTDEFKPFVKNQIEQLLDLQNKVKENSDENPQNKKDEDLVDISKLPQSIKDLIKDASSRYKQHPDITDDESHALEQKTS